MSEKFRNWSTVRTSQNTSRLSCHTSPIWVGRGALMITLYNSLGRITVTVTKCITKQPEIKGHQQTFQHLFTTCHPPPQFFSSELHAYASVLQTRREGRPAPVPCQSVLSP